MKKKRPYKRPKIVYEKKIETLAIGECGSDWLGPTTGCCQLSGCIKRAT